VIRGFGERTALRGKHRTEVTEVTEGGLRFRLKVCWWTRRLQGRERPASGKPSHRGHGGHRGGLRFGLKVSWWTRRLQGRERPASGKASHRGHGGHRGGIEVRAESSLVDTAASGARTTARVSIAQRSRRSQRGNLRFGPKVPWWTRRLQGREPRQG
jgi:hypothetical protein